MTAALELRNLWFAWPDGRAALRGVSFRVDPGERVALVGPNGAGKSTLLLHVPGLLPERGVVGHSHAHLHHHADGTIHTHEHDHAPAGGPTVWVGGLAVTEANLPDVRRRVGLLFQDPDDQLFCPTVWEDVMFGPTQLGLPPGEAERRAAEALAITGLADAAERMPSRLSFGERKRAGLAGVLACGPEVLVLDEPSANLDPRARRGLIRLLQTLPAAQIVATHDLEMVLELCPRTVLLDGGRVVADGPSRTLLADAELMERHGLEVPASVRS